MSKQGNVQLAHAECIRQAGLYLCDSKGDEYVKVRFPVEGVKIEGNNVVGEWMWVLVTDWTRGIGTLHNSPAYIDEMKWGDTIHFVSAPDGSSMFVEKGERDV